MVTNKVMNTATPTNKELSAKNRTWAETDPRTWADGGTWDNPDSVANKSRNTANLTNKAIS